MSYFYATVRQLTEMGIRFNGRDFVTCKVEDVFWRALPPYQFAPSFGECCEKAYLEMEGADCFVVKQKITTNAFYMFERMGLIF